MSSSFASRIGRDRLLPPSMAPVARTRRRGGMHSPCQPSHPLRSLPFIGGVVERRPIIHRQGRAASTSPTIDVSTQDQANHSPQRGYGASPWRGMILPASTDCVNGGVIARTVPKGSTTAEGPDVELRTTQ